MECAVKIEGLFKRYPGFAIEDLGFEIPRGLVTGLIGGNGAGKTTLMKCISGAAVKDGGNIVFDRGDAIIGVVYDECKFPRCLNGNQICRFMTRLYDNWDAECFFDLMEKFGVACNIIVKKMSRGMRMKIQIAAAMALGADILLLDEPTAGLDPVSRDEFLDIIRDWMNDDRAVLISSHITSDIEHIADVIGFMSEGRIMITGEKDSILETYGIARGSDLPFPEHVVATRRSEYGSSSLITEKAGLREAYPECTIDDASLEDILVYIARGEKA